MARNFYSLQKRQQNYLETRGWRGQTLKSITMSIGIEASELMEVYQWDADKNADEVRIDGESVERTREEVADVLIYCMNLAIELDITLLEVVQEKTEVNENR